MTHYVPFRSGILRGAGLALALAGVLHSPQASAQLAVVWEEDFSGGAADITLSNGTQTNQWVVGSAAGNPADALYISNDGGVTHAYSNVSTSVVHAWVDLDFPAGMPAIQLSYDWQGLAESCCDYIRVWLVPTTFQPTVGTQITADGSGPTGRVQLGGNHNAQSAWQSASHELSPSYAGTTGRLVFEWRNDGSVGTAPPGAVDNIALAVGSCAAPDGLAMNGLGPNGGSLVWNPNGADSYDYEVRTSGAAGSGPTGLVASGNAAAPPVPISGLDESTTYTAYVRSVCDGGAANSEWTAGLSFNTTQMPVTVFPWYEEFNGGGGFFIQNGSQTNQWVVGEAAGTPAPSLYVSNDGGESHAYSHTTSVVHAWRDLQIPAGMPMIRLSFEWQALGESCCDYIKAWLVPFSYTPTPGTLITAEGAAPGGRIQLGTNLNNQSGWQFAEFVLPPSYSGEGVRLVFEWRNDGSVGSEPPGAIDNIYVELNNCAPPETVAMIDLSQDEATLTWVENGADSYDYEIRTSGAAGSGPTGLVTSGSSATSPVVIENLDPSSNYVAYVRSVCDGGSNITDWTSGTAFGTTQVPVTVFPWIETFENGGSLSLQNTGQTNQWVVGSAAGNTAPAMYISNDGGTTHAYNNGATGVVHAWRDLSLPAGQPAITLSFDWQALAESCCDYIKVWLVPFDFLPTPGTMITADGAAPDGRVQLGGNFNGQSNWQSAVYTLAAAYAGQNVRVVFEWRNDGSVGTAPPGAIDNIRVDVSNCAAPTNVEISNITENTATISWTGGGSDGYEYEVRSSGPAGSGPTGLAASGTTAATSVPVSGLSESTSYMVYVRGLCNAGDPFSAWASGSSFSTTQVPVTVFPWFEDFSTGSSMFVQNGSQVNQWVVGNAVGDAAPALYVSNDGGATHGYNISSTSTVHAWRDLQLPVGMPSIELSFSWLGNAEACCDYIRVWLVPMSFTPTAGTMITADGVAPNGRVQIGANLNGQSSWQNVTHVLSAAYAGQSVRLVFEWRNDGSVGTMPPGAIDNIFIEVSDCARPEGLAVADVSAISAELSWLDIGATSYDYEVRTSGAAGSGPDGLVVSGNVPAPPVAVNGLSAGTTYTAYVRAQCGSGPSDWSTVLNFVTSPGCGGSFYDTGGPTGNYGNGEEEITVICPESPGLMVVLDFLEFDVESNWDKLYLFNGQDASAPMFASANGAGNGNTTYGPGGWWGTELPGTFTATNPTGCITAVFVSDASGEYPGWVASVDCITAIDCNVGANGPFMHCYANNDDTQFAYATDDVTEPLTVSFVEGQMLVGDYVTIHSGINASGPQQYMGNNAGNLAGLNVTMPVGVNAVTVQFHSNASGSCATGQAYPHAKWYVGCGNAWVGMDDEDALDHFELFPNPTNGLVTLRSGKDFEAGSVLRVFDTSGRTVYGPVQLREAVRTVDLSALQSGTYRVHVLQNERVLVRPVQVIH